MRCRWMLSLGTRVIRDTKVIEGDAAVTRGRLVTTLAVILFAFSLLGGLYFPHYLGRLFSDDRDRRAVPPGSSDPRGSSRSAVYWPGYAEILGIEVDSSAGKSYI